MTNFRCVPIATETAERFRRTRLDDRGNRVRHFVATASSNFPCRHCLQVAQAGEMMLLGAYNLPQPLGVYWTPSPIFVHETDCQRSEAVDEVPPIVRANPLVSVRAYDAEHQCIYDLGQVCLGDDVGDPLQRAMSDPRTAFVNIHTARPGCLLCAVERTSD